MHELSIKPSEKLAFWQRINKYRKKKNSNMPKLVHEGREFTTEEEKANWFADKYKKVFSDDENANFDSNFKREIEEYIKNREYEDICKDKTIKFFSPTDLNKVIKEISNKKSLDQENISNFMVKNLSEKFKLNLLKMFNHCLATNTMPEEWKKATISMIHKKGCKKSRDNYRPISITSCIAKVFEKLVLNRIKLHLKENNIIIKNQSGFRENRQTKD